MAERSQKEVWKVTPWVMIALCLGNFILMAWSAREAASQQRLIRVWALAAADFVQSPVATASNSVNNYFQSFATMLKQRVQELEVEVHNSESLAVENERLKSLLELKERSTYKILPAQIIGRDPSAWFDTSIINRGSLDGVKLNMPIVTNGGLVGRVTAVSPLTAQIYLLTREKVSEGGVIGEIGKSNALGVVSGTGKKELLEMGYVPGSIEVAVGESVFTTGQEGIYPSGLKIGEVVEVRAGSAAQAQQIFIRPSANLSALQEVAVLLYEPPARPDYEKTVPNAGKDKKK